MNERNACDEHNTQYSVPPVFSEEFGWNSQRNEIRNPRNSSPEPTGSKTTKPGSDAKKDTAETATLNKMKESR